MSKLRVYKQGTDEVIPDGYLVFFGYPEIERAGRLKLMAFVGSSEESCFQVSVDGGEETYFCHLADKGTHRISRVIVNAEDLWDLIGEHVKECDGELEVYGE